MSIFTLAEINAVIDRWKAALTAVSTGLSYEIGDRKLTRADVGEIRKTLTWLDEERQALTGQAGPVAVRGRARPW